MAQNGVIRFAGNLDPGAQEFRPTFPPHHHLSFISPPSYFPPPLHHPELIYPLQPAAYVTTAPPPPPPPVLPPSLPPPAAAPTRALLLSSVPPDVSESGVRRELEVFGDVRAVQMERVRESIVTVHFYDLRSACTALDAVREQHMQHQHRLRIHFTSIWASNNPTFGLGLEALAAPPPSPPPAPGLISGRPVWAQFTVPVTNAFPDGLNQGTIVIFNLDPNVSAPSLKQIFQTFGAVKELRETPMKRQQRFVEYYDVRDASRALTEMNGKEIKGRSVMIEFSRPGGHNHNKQHFNNQHMNKQPSPNYHHHSHRSKLIPPPPPPPSRPYPSRHRRTSPRQRIIRRHSPSSDESVDVTMSGLTLQEVDNKKNNSDSNRCKKGNVNINSKGKGNSKPWKGRQKNFDPRFLIKEEAIVEANACKDTRTTVMIKNIPNKYSQKLVLNMLDNHCIHCNEQISSAGGDQPLSSYDFLYLPIDFNNKCNVGYGFVNMTSPEATLRLYKAFHHQHWEVFNSRKICEVTYARVQGLEALKEHFKNSKFACENDEYLPVVFAPPRDGRHLTTPLPIVLSSTSLNYNPSQSDQSQDYDVDGGDFTSASPTASASTTPTTIPSSSDFQYHTHPADDSEEVSVSVSSSSSNGGEDVMNGDDDGLQ